MRDTDSHPVIRVTAMPADANAFGDILGGWLMSLMDMGAGADRLTHREPCVTNGVTIGTKP